MFCVNSLQMDDAVQKRHRSLNAPEPVGQPKLKKWKPTPLRLEHFCVRSFAFLEDVGALLQLSRISKKFNQAVKEYYDQLPSFGTEEEIFQRLVVPIFQTQRKDHHSKVQSKDVELLSRFASSHIKKLLPHQTLTARASEVCPRTIRVFGERAYALFNRCQSQGDLSLTEGSGAAFKKIELCFPLWTEELCTWKTIRCQKGDKASFIVSKQEIEIAKLISGAANVEQMYNFSVFKSKKTGTPHKLGMISPFYNCSDLFTFLQKIEDEIEHWSVNEILKIARDTANGVAELHARNIIHRDLKPENVMIHRQPSGELQATIIDLGGAVHIADKARLSLENSTCRDHYSPELCLANIEHEPLCFSFASDVWALGCIFFAMITGEELFFIDEDYNVTIDNINELDRVELPLPTKNSPAAYQYCYPLLMRMFKMEPEERPTAKDIVSWLDQFIDTEWCSSSQI